MRLCACVRRAALVAARFGQVLARPFASRAKVTAAGRTATTTKQAVVEERLSANAAADRGIFAGAADGPPGRARSLELLVRPPVAALGLLCRAAWLLLAALTMPAAGGAAAIAPLSHVRAAEAVLLLVPLCAGVAMAAAPALLRRCGGRGAVPDADAAASRDAAGGPREPLLAFAAMEE